LQFSYQRIVIEQVSMEGGRAQVFARAPFTAAAERKANLAGQSHDIRPSLIDELKMAHAKTTNTQRMRQKTSTLKRLLVGTYEVTD
jgi:hypothetical protein